VVLQSFFSSKYENQSFSKYNYIFTAKHVIFIFFFNVNEFKSKFELVSSTGVVKIKNGFAKISFIQSIGFSILIYLELKILMD